MSMLKASSKTSGEGPSMSKQPPDMDVIEIKDKELEDTKAGMHSISNVIEAQHHIQMLDEMLADHAE